MKKFSFLVLTITIVIVSLSFLSTNANAQYFNKYYTWASEKHMWPGSDYGRLPFRYSQIEYTLKGNYSGFQYHGTDIPALAYLIKHPDLGLMIFTVEARGFRTYDPVINYSNANIVNNQEGTNLDSLWYQDKGGNWFLANAYTEHPTLKRFEDSTNVFQNFDSIKFAVSGNFYGGRKDEIAVIYAANSYYQPFYFLKVNLPGDTLNYQFEIDTGKTIQNIKTYLDVQHVIHAEAGNFDNV